MQIPFIKMQALGNDFVVIDAITNDISLNDFSEVLIKKIADRKFGVGCDQLLFLESSKEKEADFFYRVFNADGGEAEQCINGVRCLAKFVGEFGLSDKKSLVFSTNSVQTKVILENDGRVTAILQPPVFDPRKLPFAMDVQAPKYNIELDGGERVEVGVVSVGNPHAVILSEHVDSIQVNALGDLVCHSKYFPEGVNVSFMKVLDPKRIKLRVYERGSGETLACGSAACAAVVVGKLWGFLQENVVVELPGGELVVDCSNSDDNILITGSAEIVFVGKINFTGCEYEKDN